MALTTCNACGHKISTKAATCPNCGNPNKSPPSTTTQVGALVIGLAVAFILIAPAITRCAEEAQQKEALQAAKTAGFSSPEEHQKAAAAGFATKAEQQAHAKAERAERERRYTIDKATRDAECRADFKCYAHSLSAKAIAACQPKIEAQAVYDHEWTDGLWGAKLTHYTKGPGPHNITYRGDQIRVQAQNGTWMRHTYTCIYNTETAKALHVTLTPGKL